MELFTVTGALPVEDKQFKDLFRLLKPKVIFCLKFSKEIKCDSQLPCISTVHSVFQFYPLQVGLVLSPFLPLFDVIVRLFSSSFSLISIFDILQFSL